jgi:elongation factor Ts
MAPQYVRREDVPEDIVDRERAVYREQVQGKPENIVEKILTGKLNSFYAQICLLEQPWIKDDKKKVGDLVTEAIARLGENISVARFARFAVGAESTESDGASAPAAE